MSSRYFSLFFYKAGGVAHKEREPRGTPATPLNREEECDIHRDYNIKKDKVRQFDSIYELEN